jgi:hypothetical protein
MKFTSVIATILSMAVFAVAAPIANEGQYSSYTILNPVTHRQVLTCIFLDVVARQNHGMCVKSTAGQVEQIENC